MTIRWDPIRAVLDTQLLTLAGLNPAYVSWPNLKFDKPSGQIWYAPSLLPVGVDAASGLAGSTNEKGIYQIAINAPANDAKREINLLKAVDAVSNLFDRVQLAGTGLKVQCAVPIPSPLLTVEAGWVSRVVSVSFVAL